MKPIVKVVLLVAVVAGAYFGYTKLKDAQFGVASETPLGTFEALDTYLVEDVRLLKSEAANLPVRDIRASPRMYRYTNPRNEYESVTLMLDGANTVQGILGVYWMGDFGSNSPVMGFSQSYWRRLGGPRQPEFTTTPQGRMRVSEASMESDRAVGTWRQFAEEGQTQVVIHLQVR